MCGTYRVVATLRLFVSAFFLCQYGGPTGVLAEKGEKVEYIRLPLLTFDRNENADFGERGTTVARFPVSFPLVNASTPTVAKVSQRRSVGEENEVINGTNININKLLESLTGVSEEEDEIEDEEDDHESTTGRSIEDEAVTTKEMEEDGVEADDNEDCQFDELDLIDLVQELEHQADMEEQTGIFPEILDILHGKQQQKKVNSTVRTSTSTTTPKSFLGNQEGISNITMYKSGTVTRSNGTLRISLNEDGDLQLNSAEDLSHMSDEIAEGISEGVEEYLRMSDDLELDENLLPPGFKPDNATSETRQFSLYLFQGQYYAEPRLNRFIDGALRNMGTELRVASMDPLYFRVLPRGQVA